MSFGVDDVKQAGYDPRMTLTGKKYVLMHGVMPAALRDIPDGIVNAIVTSPPYYGLRADDVEHGRTPGRRDGESDGSVTAAKKNKGGRPPLPKGEAHAKMFSTRLTPDELRRVKATAKQAGKSASQWARDLIVSATGAENQTS